MMKYLAIFLVVSTLACNTTPKHANQDTSQKIISELLTVDQFDSKYGELKGQDFDFNLVDVRKPSELEELGYLADAVNINYNSPTFKTEIAKLRTDIPILVYCKSGGRSGKATKLFNEMGFTEIYDLDGGITAWKASERSVNEQ